MQREDVEIISEDIPGWQVASENGVSVALDINLDEQLLAEGTARELVNRIQNIRKNQGLNVTDRIKVDVEKLSGIEKAVTDFGEYIKSETLANEIGLMTEVMQGEKVEWLEGEEISIVVHPAS